MIKVCHISTVHGLNDSRILYKQCTSLAKYGFDVSLVIQNDKPDIINGVKIVPLKLTKSRPYRIFISTWIAFFKALKTNSKIFHFHDPELLPFAILFKLFGKKVIFDSHEDVGFQILHKPYLKNKQLKLLISNLFLFFQWFVSFFLDKIIVVTDLMLPRFNINKTVVISNYPLLIESDLDVKKSDIISFIYLGGLSEVRNTKEIVLAHEALSHKSNFNILGSFDSINYESFCKSLPHWNQINYYGQQTFYKAQKIISQSHIGILVLKSTPNHLLSLPIKAFEYMYNGLPFIASDFPFWRNLFADCAIFVDPENIDDISNAMNLLLTDGDLRNTLGNNGKKAVLEKYNWIKEESKLILLYNELLPKKKLFNVLIF